MDVEHADYRAVDAVTLIASGITLSPYTNESLSSFVVNPAPVNQALTYLDAAVDNLNRLQLRLTYQAGNKKTISYLTYFGPFTIQWTMP